MQKITVTVVLNLNTEDVENTINYLKQDIPLFFTEWLEPEETVESVEVKVL